MWGKHGGSLFLWPGTWRPWIKDYISLGAELFSYNLEQVLQLKKMLSLEINQFMLFKNAVRKVLTTALQIKFLVRLGEYVPPGWLP